jgi:hypothetical protein
MEENSELKVRIEELENIKQILKLRMLKGYEDVAGLRADAKDS